MGTVGHSQGGQAALGAAQYASRAQLNYKGTVAIAPASKFSCNFDCEENKRAAQLTNVEDKISTLAILDTYTALIAAGLRNKNPSLEVISKYLNLQLMGLQHLQTRTVKMY